MTPHGKTTTIPINKGTMQGDTLLPFMYTRFMKPILRWLSIGSRGYKSMHHPGQPASIYMTYGYAYGISITTSILDNLQIHIKKLHLFSKYTALELETTKCETAREPYEQRKY